MTVRVAALLEPRACSAPRLRALASRLAGAPVGVIGTAPDAQRARDAGLAVLRSHAPALGAVGLGVRSLRAAFPGVRPGTGLPTLGARAVDAARALGAVPLDPPDASPAPEAPVSRDALRAAWGAVPGVAACLLVASPAAAADARAALDVAGRAAILGGPVVLVVHPGSANVGRALELARAAGGAWRIALEPRADDPELLALAADAAISIDVRAAPAPRRGRVAAAFARGCAPSPPPGDPLGVALALRAGIRCVAAGCSAAARAGIVDAGSCFDARRPNEGARLLHAILSAASR